MLIKNVRCSYPSIFTKAVFDGEETKYQCTFLLDKKDVTTYALIQKMIEDCKEENKSDIKGQLIHSNKTFIRDGDEVGYPETLGNWVINAKNNRRPTVINRDKSPLVESDGIIYAGCYVNASISVWYSNHKKGGKQILANLNGVQFFRDGDQFGESNDVDEFEDLGSEVDKYEDVPF